MYWKQCLCPLLFIMRVSLVREEAESIPPLPKKRPSGGGHLFPHTIGPKNVDFVIFMQFSGHFAQNVPLSVNP